MLPAALRHLLAFLTLLLPPYVLFSVGLLTWERATGSAGTAALLAGAGVLAAGLIFGWLFRQAFWRGFDRLHRRLEQQSPVSGVAVLLSVGLLLRVAWVLAFPADPKSDEQVYVDLALQLASGGEYYAAGTYSFWPPGFPLLLSLVFRLFEPGKTLYFALNAVWFLGTAWVCYLLAQRLGGKPAGLLAVALIAAWPALISLAGLPNKELLLTLLLPLAVWLYYRRSSQGDRLSVLASGLVLGFATLTQPSLQLIFLALVVGDVMSGGRPLRILGRCALLVVGMLVVILPWSARNYLVHDQFVFLTTNGGGGLFMANNDLATGGWSGEGYALLEGMGELETNRYGYEHGKQWIKDHPAAFFKLMLRKHQLFLGDDATGVYNSLKRGLEITDWRYPALKLAANLFWAALWLVLFIVLIRQGAAAWFAHPPAAALMLTFFYLFAIHSLFESASKYHLPALGALAVIVAALLFRISPSQTKSAAVPEDQNCNVKL